MLKKIIVILLIVGLLGVLMIGAVNRTLARVENDGNGQGLGRQAAGSEVSNQSFGYSQNTDQGQGNDVYGRARGGQGLSNEEFRSSLGSYSNTESGKMGGNRQGRDEITSSHEFTAVEQAELNEAEKEILTFMREEEKLAHDVYVKMYELWGLPIFQNISSSEQLHTEAVEALLNVYQVPDPASSEIGVFTNPDLQTLYNDLVGQGSQSLSEALRVGAAIEEIDILDLQESLTQTDNADIQHVLTNLLKGSSNHLKAFTSTLFNQTGETYQPQFMSMENYQAIIGETDVNGGQGKGFRGGRN